MKFRMKFGAQGWCLVSLASLYAYIVLLNGKGRPTMRWMAVVWICWAVVRILSYFFAYLQVDPAGLRQRGFWTTREIAWAEIKHVGGLNGRPSAAMLAVNYSRDAPMSDHGHILANPEDRRGFIEELCKFAPQATFEV